MNSRSSRTLLLIVDYCQSRSKYLRTISLFGNEFQVGSSYVTTTKTVLTWYKAKKKQQKTTTNSSNRITRIKGRRTECQSNRNKQV